MINRLLTTVMKLHIPDLPNVFDASLLEERAQSLLVDLRTLLKTDAVLQHTTLIHNFRIAVDDRQLPCLMIVIGLGLSNQRVLDFKFRTMSLGDLELSTLEDRQRMVNACKNLPTQSALVSLEFSRRISAACLDLPVEDLQPGLSKRLKVLLGVTRRNWRGTLADHPWQHQLPTIAKFEWLRELFSVRVQLHREQRGYALTLLRRESLPEALRHTRKLRMPERPVSVEITSILDRAEHTGAPVNMVIRAGHRSGSNQLIVADFVGFKDATGLG